MAPDVKDESRQGYLWTHSRPGGDGLFKWRTSRLRAGSEEFLKDLRGKLQADGYSAYAENGQREHLGLASPLF